MESIPIRQELFLLGLLFNSEDDGSMLLQNVMNFYRTKLVTSLKILLFMVIAMRTQHITFLFLF
jgi:hypothetical protein